MSEYLDNLTKPIDMIRLNSIDSSKIINPNLQEELDDSNPNQTDNVETTIIINTNNINIYTDPDTLYVQLLDEIYETISENNELFGNKNTNISKPDIKYQNRKTFWFNYGKNCEQINRTVVQLKKFFEKELAVETSINEKSNLILRGKYNFNLIASTYKKYIKNYVQCTTCKSFNTEIVRNSSNRLDYLKCLNPKCNTCKVV